MSKGLSSGWTRWVLLLAAAAIVPACHNDDDDDAAAIRLNLGGGTGSGFDGGDGGYFDVEANSGNNVYILKGGSVETVSALPAITTPYLGTNAVTISSDTTWDVGGELADASQTVTVGGTVTGFRVAAGSTLTIKPNYPGGGPYTYGQISVANGVIVEGTIVIDYREDASVNDASDFYLYSENLVIRPGGRILLRGRNMAAGSNGGNGGNFYDYADSTVINQGLVSTTGGTGDNGGQGGDLYFGYGSYFGAYNTGTLETDGAVGSNGYGGDAGTLYFHADDGYGPCINSGMLSARGANGTTDGGYGGYVDLYSYYGILASFGSILTSGGNATDAASNGNGGDGGDFYAYAYGEFRISGMVETNGGTGLGTGDGGDGGYVYLYGDEDLDNYYGEYTTFGMYIGASFNTTGGSGEYGGDGGDFYVYRYDEGVVRPDKEPVYLVGYDTIHMSGGDGYVDGGDSDYVYVWAGYDYDWTSTYYMGSIYIESDVVMNGGNGQTGVGGWSEDYYVEGDYPEVTTQNSDYGVWISGSVRKSGGNGAIGGGDSDYVYIYGRWNAVVTGSIVANGGSTTSGTAGYADYVEVESSYNVSVTGGIAVNGGSSADDDGGTVDGIYIWGLYTTVSGALSANGGAGGSGAGDFGADGGFVEIGSQEAVTVFSASVSNAGGAGFTPGANGDFWLDGIHVSGP